MSLVSSSGALSTTFCLKFDRIADGDLRPKKDSNLCLKFVGLKIEVLMLKSHKA